MLYIWLLKNDLKRLTLIKRNKYLYTLNSKALWKKNPEFWKRNPNKEISFFKCKCQFIVLIVNVDLKRFVSNCLPQVFSFLLRASVDWRIKWCMIVWEESVQMLALSLHLCFVCWHISHHFHVCFINGVTVRLFIMFVVPYN